MSNKTMTTQNELRKDLKPINVWAIAFGCILGWGAFINPGKLFLPASGVAGSAVAFLFGAIVMGIIACSYAYLVPKYPKAGGEFTFAKNCFGTKAAFLCGWFLVAAYLANVPMNATAIGLVIDGLDGSADILKCGFHYSIAGFKVYIGEILVESFVLILFGILNILGVKKAGFVQTILAVLLGVSVMVLLIAAIASGKANWFNMNPLWGFNKEAAAASNATGAVIQAYAHRGKAQVVSAVLATFVIAPWAFVGFDTIPQAAEEFKFSYRKVLGIMMVAIAFGAFVYISNTTIAAAALGDWPDRVLNGEWVVLDAAEELLGVFGKLLVGIAVSSAVLSGIMGFYLAASRLIFSMSRDGYLPPVFGVLDPKYGTPKNAMIFCMIVSLSGPLLGREALGWFVDMSAIGASIGYFFTSGSMRVTMRRGGDRNYKLKFAATAGVFFSLAFMVFQLFPIPGLNGVHMEKESYYMLAIWIVLGLMFFLKQKSHFSPPDKP